MEVTPSIRNQKVSIGSDLQGLLNLDAVYFHLYGIARDDEDYSMEIFPIANRKDEQKYGEHRTKRII